MWGRVSSLDMEKDVCSIMRAIRDASMSKNSMPFADGSIDVGTNEWHHVCGTYDGATIRLYIDGVLDATKAYTGGITTNFHDVSIGENVEAWGRYWNGMIDEVQVYNHALGAAAVGSAPPCSAGAGELDDSGMNDCLNKSRA